MKTLSRHYGDTHLNHTVKLATNAYAYNVPNSFFKAYDRLKADGLLLMKEENTEVYKTANNSLTIVLIDEKNICTKAEVSESTYEKVLYKLLEPSL